jgi:hypothetical protein
VLHLVILPECLPSHTRELQLGLRAVRRSYGIRLRNVRRPRKARLRGPGRESHPGGAGLGLKGGINGGCRVRMRL